MAALVQGPDPETVKGDSSRQQMARAGEHGLLLGQDQLAVFQRNLAAGIRCHPYPTGLITDAVFDIVANGLLATVIHRLAAGLGCGIGFIGLHAFLRLVARVPACGRARDGGDFLATTATHLVTQQSAYDSSSYRAQYLILVLYGFLAAFLSFPSRP